ncbi:MAG: hypothetical protein KQH53_11335 [Desulfarculaceae bacterium]|nr:hypothetical protein [Desulfarculaceae bacterium]
MSECRFMYENLVNGPGGLTVSSAAPGAVGTPAPEALGSAVCYAGGSHTGRQDQVFVVEIDGEGADGAVGQATFRWQRASASGWEASGVPTSSAFVSLADGVMVKWAPGAGQDLYKGDRWSLLAVGRHGEQPLCDRDRDTRWRSNGCAAEWVQVELAEPARARAVVLGDHNLSDAASATLKGTDTPEPAAPLWSFDPSGAALLDNGGVAGSNARATGRTYMDGGLIKYAAPGESCFEDGKLSIQPAATNLLIYSEAFDNAAWLKARASISADAATAPDGNVTADILAPSVDAGTHYVEQLVSGLTDNTVYTYLIFLKKKEYDWAIVFIQGKDGGAAGTYFDLSNGAMGTQDNAGAGMELIGSGWYRCWVNDDIASGGSTPRFRVYVGTGDGGGVLSGDGTSGLYLWGAQLEAGKVPTAYIPTTSAPDSRAADAVRWSLPQPIKNLLSTEQPAPTAALTQTAGALAASLAEDAAFVMPGMGSAADLSPYAGSHVIKLTDSAGKTAWAWLGAAGTGETLGSELLTNGGMESGSPPSIWSAVGSTLSSEADERTGGSGSASLGVTNTGTNGAATQAGLADMNGKLVYASWWFKSAASGNFVAYNRGLGGTSSGGAWTLNRAYLTGTASNSAFLYVLGAATTFGQYDDVSLKQVIAPPATGCLVSKTPGGANGWAYVQSGFDPNAITAWAVYAAPDWSAEGTLVLRGWVPGFGGADIASGFRTIVGVYDSRYGLLEYTPAGIYTDCGPTYGGVAFTYSAGTSYDLAVRWSSQTSLMQVGYKLSSATTWAWGTAAAFDGDFVLGDYLNLCHAAAHACCLGAVELRGTWLGDPLERSLSPWENPEHSQALDLTRPHLVGFLDQAHKYWRLELRDPDNPEGVLKASLFYLGGSFAPERTFAAGYVQGSAAGRRLTTSEAGKVAGNATALAAFYELSFPRLSAGDAAGFEAMMAAIHDHAGGGLRPILFTPFSDDPAGTVYCLPTAELTRRRLPGGRWELGLRLEEVVRTDV